MSRVSPCKDCPDRFPGCHDHCDKYKQWKDERDAEQKHLADNKYRFDIPSSPAREKVRRKYGADYNFTGGYR